uniref:Transthyretin-like family protein n=1 Tax=Acrobeloides nanus TaxID=290746 RepID=A0A914CKM6_9BILA
MFLPIALIVFVSISSFSEALSSNGRKQKIDVIGSLTCDGKPASGVLVQLYDTNKLNYLLGKANTNSNGYFDICGKVKNITKMNPKVNIYTKCHVGAMRCSRKITIKVPHSAINKRNTYSIGHIELKNKFPGETRDCITF